MNPGPLFAEAEIIPIDDCEERSSTMFHPDILAALAKERRNTMLAEAAARPAGQTGQGDTAAPPGPRLT